MAYWFRSVGDKEGWANRAPLWPNLNPINHTADLWFPDYSSVQRAVHPGDHFIVYAPGGPGKIVGIAHLLTALKPRSPQWRWDKKYTQQGSVRLLRYVALDPHLGMAPAGYPILQGSHNPLNVQTYHKLARQFIAHADQVGLP